MQVLELWPSLEKSGFIDFARRNDVIKHDLADRVYFSTERLYLSMARLSGDEKQQMEEHYVRLRSLANEGKVAKVTFKHGHPLIMVLKHIEGNEYGK